MTEANRIRHIFNTAIKRHYERRSTMMAVITLVAHVGSSVVAAIVAHHVSSTQPDIISITVAFVAVFWIGTRFRALANMMHECAHGILVPVGRHNRMLGHLLGVIDFTAFERYVLEHRTHHVYLGDSEKDLDFAPRARFRFAEPITGHGLRHLLTPLFLLHMPYYLRPVLFDRSDALVTRIGRLGYLAGLACLAHFVIGWPGIALYFVLPYATTYQMMRYWSDAADHAGVVAASDEFERTRNHALPWGVLNAIIFPRSDAFHLIHHLFPNVPTHHYADVHQVLLRDPRYAARRHRLLQPTSARQTRATNAIVNQISPTVLPVSTRPFRG
jgi:fatty acid desaturase